MDFFEAVKNRRSVRRYTDEKVPEEVMRKAFAAALVAPNSSNLQTWDFYWVRSADKKKQLVQFCLNQSAARKAQELVVVTANYKMWKRANGAMIDYIKNTPAAPKAAADYYKKLIPITYRTGLLNILAPFKWLLLNSIGLFRPIVRGPYGVGGLTEVAIKSSALACENFVLALSAQGFSSCMMEGFDECRIKKLLGLAYRERVVMVISVGKSAEDGVWGPQFRIPTDQVIHEV